MPVIFPMEHLDERLTSKPVEAARLVGPAPEGARGGGREQAP